MTLIIKSPEVGKLARELSLYTGETVDEAVENALRERLEREKRREAHVATLVERILEISRAFASLPIYDRRSPDEIIGYDELGLPS
jgi:antitoxin VapB